MADHSHNLRLFGLIGYPLGHSFSKRYFTEKFEKEGLTNHKYELFPLASIEELPALLSQQATLCGFNVTIPYKTAILPYLNGLHPEAEKIGAVNTVVVRDQKLFGFNTDVFGFERSLKEALQSRLEPIGSALILGTGGASKAVAFVLGKMGIPYSFVSRNENFGGFLYKDLNKKLIEDNNLIINTTPLGMYPKIEEQPPIPYQFIKEKHLLYDLIYNPEETSFMQQGQKQGAQVLNGLKMLYLQAEQAWEYWNKDPHEAIAL